MDTITRINGNGHPYTVDLPRIVIQSQDMINDAALDHIEENTGLRFETNGLDYYSAKPTDSKQIVALLLTYDFKTNYWNNWSNSNTLFLKFDHHVGFKVDSICFECAKHNHINTLDLRLGDRLSC